jgi:alkylation response protein AidB-like acyl-CoA dehydrogenase
MHRAHINTFIFTLTDFLTYSISFAFNLLQILTLWYAFVLLWHSPCLRGEKVICLCITEPYVGSDVTHLRTEAKKTPDGNYYIVNGEKKWITNGIFADYFTVACRTGGPGMGGTYIHTYTLNTLNTH